MAVKAATPWFRARTEFARVSIKAAAQRFETVRARFYTGVRQLGTSSATAVVRFGRDKKTTFAENNARYGAEMVCDDSGPIFLYLDRLLGITVALDARRQGLVASPKYLLGESLYLPSDPPAQKARGVADRESRLDPVPSLLLWAISRFPIWLLSRIFVSSQPVNARCGWRLPPR